MCRCCGSFGKGAEGHLIPCSQCGQCYHPYCVNVKVGFCNLILFVKQRATVQFVTLNMWAGPLQLRLRIAHSVNLKKQHLVLGNWPIPVSYQRKSVWFILLWSKECSWPVLILHMQNRYNFGVQFRNRKVRMGRNKFAWHCELWVRLLKFLLR